MAKKVTRRGKRYSSAEKKRILTAAAREKLTGAQVAKRFGVSTLTFYRWRGPVRSDALKRAGKKRGRPKANGVRRVDAAVVHQAVRAQIEPTPAPICGLGLRCRHALASKATHGVWRLLPSIPRPVVAFGRLQAPQLNGHLSWQSDGRDQSGRLSGDDVYCVRAAQGDGSKRIRSVLLK